MQIFHVLDQKQRGFVSKVELSHILDAMQVAAPRERVRGSAAHVGFKVKHPEVGEERTKTKTQLGDTSRLDPGPYSFTRLDPCINRRGLSPRKIQRDCRVNLLGSRDGEKRRGWRDEVVETERAERDGFGGREVVRGKRGAVAESSGRDAVTEREPSRRSLWSPVFPPVGAMKPSCELRTEPKTTSRCEASRCEREVKVETELRDLWADALRRWRDDLLLLQSRDLHRYLCGARVPDGRWGRFSDQSGHVHLPTATGADAKRHRSDTSRVQPGSEGQVKKHEVARWLRLRDQTPGLGFTQHEVETLFAVWTPSAGFFEAAKADHAWRRQTEPMGLRDVAQEMLQAMSIARLQVNLIHYNVVLSAFGPVPQWASAVSVLGRLRACGLLPDAFSFTHLCSACNSWPKALGLLSQLPASNTICFNGLIRVVDRDWPLAMEILQVMSHRRLKPESWTASSCAAACKEKWRMALQLLEVDGGDVVVNTVVSACEQAKSWRRSLQVLLGGAVRRLSASVLRHSAAVAAIDWAMGLQLWEEMRKLLLWPNEITCSSALTACGRSVTWRAAASLLVRPNAICRRMATVAFEQASQWADACVLGSEAASRPVAIVALGSSSRWRHALQFRSASSRGIGPSEEAAALLGGLATAGAWEMALQDAWWKDVSPPALHSILRAIAKARRWPLAFRLLRHLQLLRTRPSGGVAYSIVLDSCDTAGAWNTALHQLDAPVVLAAMPAPVGSCPGAGAAVSACQREAQWRWALRLLPEPAEPADEMSFVSAMNAIPAWTRAIWLLCSSPLARIQPHERLQNSAVASAAAGSAWQLAMHVRPRVGGAAELEVLAACERRDLWTSVTIGVQAVQDVALLGLQGVSDKKVDSVRVARM
ncbi:unnamed protein product [Durusdinium trenchii]|uniref:EF-hand domain-containing protein n=1 Tax=Durusdinium trenchii TaxID=1381693 RepID=A0ABP0JW87_9DINO